jgi:ATP-dependent Clp protease ATP-binding subunit ClpA
MFERFTDRARRVVVVAQEESRNLGHNYIGTEHILLGILGAGGGVAVTALESLGIGRDAVRQQVVEVVGTGPHEVAGHIPFTPRAKKVLELSLREALQFGHNYIGTEHILLGLINEGEGVAAQVLVQLGAELDRTRQKVTELLQAHPEAAEYSRPFRRPGRGAGLDAIAGRLDAIAGQLAAITSKLGIGPEPGSGPAPEPEPVPEALRQLDRRIGEIRTEKEAAIDAQDFERAVTLRDEERDLLARRDAEQRRWLAAAEQRQLQTAAGQRQSATVATAELDRLRRVISDLRTQLHRHGIDPDAEPPAGTAPQ